MGRRKNHVQRATPTPPPPNPVLEAINREVVEVLRRHLPHGVSVTPEEYGWPWQGNTNLFRLTCANYRKDMNRHCSLEPGHSDLCFSSVFREHFVADSVFSVEES